MEPKSGPRAKDNYILIRSNSTPQLAYLGRDLNPATIGSDSKGLSTEFSDAPSFCYRLVDGSTLASICLQ